MSKPPSNVDPNFVPPTISDAPKIVPSTEAKPAPGSAAASQTSKKATVKAEKDNATKPTDTKRRKKKMNSDDLESIWSLNRFLNLTQFFLFLESILVLVSIPYALYLVTRFLKYRSVVETPLHLALLSLPAQLCLNIISTSYNNWGIFVIKLSRHSALHVPTIRAVIVSKTTTVILLIVGACLSLMLLARSSHAFHANLVYEIESSLNDPENTAEIHQLQQEFQCCGVEMKNTLGADLTSGTSHPWYSWFSSTILDETFPMGVRSLYTLPWSCCNFREPNCFHFGISRYISNVSSPHEYYDQENSVKGSDWNSVRFDEKEKRTMLAMSTVYSSDCAQELEKAVQSTGKILAIVLAINSIVSTFAILALILLWIRVGKDQTSKRAKIEGTDSETRSSQKIEAKDKTQKPSEGKTKQGN